MRSLGKKTLISLSAATLLGSAALMGAGPAAADPWQDPWQTECNAYPVNNTSAYSTCNWFGRQHQVKIQCRYWWGWFGSSWATYERRGPVVWGPQQSWAHCDTPGTLQSWEVVTYWW
ncbi:hypothetical protein [Nocardia yamanashiensis]|uniref:hypothetical protein n=1 Tax=Nocardia yamanashiensis TaxID=209247 RepID=UPI0008357EA5|nr:hypothetical protein [Nocardia yamanashiensis]